MKNYGSAGKVGMNVVEDPKRLLQNSLTLLFNRPNVREIKICIKSNKINFYNNFIYNFA